MKLEVTFLDDDASLVQSVFSYLEFKTTQEQNNKVAELILEWAQKWLYEMARKAKDKVIDMRDTS